MGWGGQTIMNPTSIIFILTTLIKESVSLIEEFKKAGAIDENDRKTMRAEMDKMVDKLNSIQWYK